MSEELNLNKRQQTLFDRLVKLGEWACNEELPVEVEEIIGFGSFFRGKSTPQDVDLILKIKHPDTRPNFQKFISILGDIRYDWDLEKKFAKPLDALEAMLKKRDPRFKGVSKNDQRKFLTWIKPYSWKMLRPDRMFQFESPTSYSKRMIKKKLPNINVVNYVGGNIKGDSSLGIRCGFTVSVWSKENPDTSANLIELFSDSEVSKNLLLEVAYFNVQHSVVKAEAELLQAEIKLLFQMKRRNAAEEFSWRWFDDLSKDHEDLQIPRKKLKRANKKDDQFGKTGQPENSQSPTKVNIAKTAPKVDSIRKEIKSLRFEVDWLKDIRWALSQYKSTAVKTKLAADEFVVSQMLGHGSKRDKEKKADYLRQNGYPVDRVLKREEKEWNQRRYGNHFE